MAKNVDWTKIGELAKEFTESVDARIKAGSAPITSDKVREALGDDLSQEMVSTIIEGSKKLKFIEGATEDELFTLYGAILTGEDFVHVAEVYAKLLDRKGLSGEFKELVPQGARNTDVVVALEDTAPTFAVLCR